MRRTKPLTCHCKDEANRKVDNGELSQTLSRSHTITGRARESIVQQALDRRSYAGGLLRLAKSETALVLLVGRKTTLTSSSTDHNTNMKKNRRPSGMRSCAR